MIAGTKVLVTGAAGFIGSHLVEELLRREVSVRAMIRYTSGSRIGNLEFLGEDSGNLQVIAGDLEDADFVLRAIEGVDIVIHLAALIAIPYSYVAPRSYIRTNVEGTLNVLQAARKLNIKRLVHTSTSEVYGTAVQEPIGEDHPLQGQSPYSASKIGADKLAESYFRSFGTPVVTVRPFNTYGPRQSGRAFIPTIICQALERDVIELGSLEPQRDMTFVSDTVDGVIRAAVYPGIEGETINLGTGQTHSIGEFLERILQLMGVVREVRTDPRRVRPAASEVMKLVSSNQKARRILEWEPKIGIDEGLRHTIDFVTKYRVLYQPTTYMI